MQYNTHTVQSRPECKPHNDAFFWPSGHMLFSSGSVYRYVSFACLEAVCKKKMGAAMQHVKPNMRAITKSTSFFNKYQVNN